MKKINSLELGSKAFELKNKGYSFRKIALEIGISPETVRREYMYYLSFWESLENGTFALNVNNNPIGETLEELKKIAFKKERGIV